MSRLMRALLISMLAIIPDAAVADIVGTKTLALVDPATQRQVTSEIWYPALSGSRVEWISPRAPIKPIPIARSATPAAMEGRLPLIVLSHGNWGTRYSQGWLALELVRSGYLVLSVTHPGTAADDQTVPGRHRLWDRSRDVTFALDEILKDPQWSRRIDDARIGFVGHSFGGFTGISLAGGRYDHARQLAHCAAAVAKDFYCRTLLQDPPVEIDGVDVGASFRDVRIKAFYIMASGPGQGFATESLRSISTPILIDTAQWDEVLDPAANSSHLARQVPSAIEVVRPVGHFAYVPECRWLVGPILARLAGVTLCEDPKGVERGTVHKRVAQDVAAYFNKTLVSTMD